MKKNGNHIRGGPRGYINLSTCHSSESFHDQ
jgi:hypothetical protein